MIGVKSKTMALVSAATIMLTSLSAGVGIQAIETPPSSQNPFGMTAYLDELFAGKKHDWTDGGNNDPKQEDLLKDFAWRAQYYDGNPDWDGFYSFKFMKAYSWSDKIDGYVFGQNWLAETGQIKFESGIPYLVLDPSEGIGALSLTYIAPKDGTYKVFPNSAHTQIRVMYPKYFPGGAEYNDGQYVPKSSVLKLGFAIHKMSETADGDTFVPSGATKIYPQNGDFAYLTKDSISMEFPTINDIQLKKGERLRFVLDCTGTSGIEDWLLSASMFPMVKNTDNTAPTAADAEASCTIGKSVSGVLQGNDVDEDAQLTYSLKTDATKGTAVVNADGTYTYTANIGVEGTDSFVYTVTDENGASADGTVTVTFVENKKPVAGKTSFSIMEKTDLAGDLKLSDEDGDTVSATVKTDAAHGDLTLNTNGTFTYSPADGYVGADTFVVTLFDEKVNVEVTVTVDVQKNEPPVAKEQVVNAKKNDSTEIELKATDVNGTDLTYTITQQPKNGTAVVSEGKVTYTPGNGFVGFDEFSVVANDGVNNSNEAKITVAVLGDGMDATQTLLDAIKEEGKDFDLNKPFDFSFVAYDLPWQFHYRIDGITGDIDDQSKPRFETAIVAKIFDWGGYIIQDGNTYPGYTIQNAGFLGSKMIGALNSGYLEDAKNPVAALTFVAPQDATYYLTAGDVTDQFGIWDGQAKDNPIKVWVEADDGTVVWPEDGKPLELSSQKETVDLPNILISMKKGAALRFCSQGTTKNGDHNNVYLNPVAYEMGSYDELLDPVKKPDEPTDPTDPSDPTDPTDPDEPTDPSDTDSPETGTQLPVAMAMLTLTAGAGLVACRKKRK